MSSDKVMITFNDVWKKYSRHPTFQRNLREDLSNLFSFRSKEKNLSKDEFWAIQGADFKVYKGESLGLHGPNGAGKSTLLKMIAGVTCPTRGSVTVYGKIAPLLEIGAGFHPDFSGEENIFINGAILGMSIKEIRRKMPSIIDFSGIKDSIDMPVKKYSSGMYVRLAFSIAIHSEADIYLFDEVIAVGDESFQNKCMERVKLLQEADKTVVVVTHNKPLLDKMSNRILSVCSGQVRSACA